MRRAFVAGAAVLLALASSAAAQDRQSIKAEPGTLPIEANVRKLWEAFKKKDKFRSPL